VNLIVDIQTASSEPVPSEGDIRHWILAALNGRSTQSDVEISVRLVDVDEMSQLNETYRGKKGPTNVLSFPADLPPELELPLLGDIVICAPVVAAEAVEQGKSANAHWAHMTVHGTLHLLGYDHVQEEDAVSMEALESIILSQMDYDCPYEARSRQEHLSQ
jgi:probable rRNA maturation factor